MIYSVIGENFYFLNNNTVTNNSTGNSSSGTSSDNSSEQYEQSLLISDRIVIGKIRVL